MGNLDTGSLLLSVFVPKWLRTSAADPQGPRTDRGFAIHDHRNAPSRDPSSRGTLTEARPAAVKKPSLRELRALVRVSLPAILVVAIGLAITVIAFLAVSRAEEQDVIRALEFRVEWRTRD